MEKLKRILVIDDEKECREFLAGLLRENGYRVDCARGGKEALKLIESNHYSLIITDHNMPELKGLELVVIVQKMEPNLPIIGMSGEALEREFIKRGASFFIKKPIDVMKLLEILKKFL